MSRRFVAFMGADGVRSFSKTLRLTLFKEAFGREPNDDEIRRIEEEVERLDIAPGIHKIEI